MSIVHGREEQQNNLYPYFQTLWRQQLNQQKLNKLITKNKMLQGYIESPDVYSLELH